MVRFGVVGTNFITDELIRCGRQVQDFQLTAVYSRTEERAREYAGRHGAAHWFTDLAVMAQSQEVDAVYIASPNSFHASQAILCMQQGKHVLCEKPLASNVREAEAMFQAARENGGLLMEAMKTLFLPNFQAVKDALPEIGRVRRYMAQFCQYSSRYDRYLQGERPNTFLPEFSNGALMDLGVYCLQPLTALFGRPKEVRANAVMLPTGVDGEGSLLLNYGDMEAVIFYSKISDSALPAEIQGEQGRLQMDKVSRPDKITLIKNGQSFDRSRQQADHMTYEIAEFIRLIQNGQTESPVQSFDQSLAVMEIVEAARRQTGIRYPADLDD